MALSTSRRKVKCSLSQPMKTQMPSTRSSSRWRTKNQKREIALATSYQTLKWMLILVNSLTLMYPRMGSSFSATLMCPSTRSSLNKYSLLTFQRLPVESSTLFFLHRVALSTQWASTRLDNLAESSRMYLSSMKKKRKLKQLLLKWSLAWWIPRSQTSNAGLSIASQLVSLATPQLPTWWGKELPMEAALVRTSRWCSHGATIWITSWDYFS